MVNKDQYFDNDTITLGQWITTYLLMCIPIVGIVMLFVWAFSNGVNPSKKTWAQCVLIVMLFVLPLIAHAKQGFDGKWLIELNVDPVTVGMLEIESTSKGWIGHVEGNF